SAARTALRSFPPRRSCDLDRPRRPELVGRAVGAVAGTVLGYVADAHAGPALERGRAEAVGRAVVGDTVAVLGHVTLAHRRPAECGALLIGRTIGAVPRTGLGHVADADSHAADLRRRLERVRGTV